MSSAAVATIACLALVGAAGMAVWVVWQHRRTDELIRSLTARKWDIVTLRAEVGALRRELRGSVDPTTPPDTDAADHADGEGPGARAVVRAPAGATTSPTAWRRDRARAASSRPRRRRLF